MNEPIVERAVSTGLFEDHRWAILFDVDALERRFRRLESAFPDETLHAVAVKANPLTGLLEVLTGLGAGHEAASAGEVRLARRTGVSSDRIVYDSPAKTPDEIERALETGVRLNADNLEELERIDACDPPADARVGIRINPVVGAGDIEATSVATEHSPFGVSLTRRRRALTEAFRRYPWLDGLHVHTGSQGLGLSLLVEGVRRCVQFAEDIERTVESGRIETIDIGGGLPVAYRPNETAPLASTYAEALREEVPALFGGDWKIVTEFGRWLHAPCARAASRVEYVKSRPGGHVATIHFGADLMLRTAYRPDEWYHRVTIHEPSGTRRSDPEANVTVAGPLCFSGDLVARDRRLPRPEAGDLAVVHDVGGYTFSMWSRYCSRPFPPVYGIRNLENERTLEPLHPGESLEDVVDFWSRADR